MQTNPERKLWLTVIAQAFEEAEGEIGGQTGEAMRGVEKEKIPFYRELAKDWLRDGRGLELVGKLAGLESFEIEELLERGKEVGNERENHEY